ncbi:MAG TPA: dihydrodipicolinate synthase family protein [Pyrinomonadaceae bacterium]|nr:dihydrodipicolinate synthase family protein [Pyrinomonadaceae bacterium]
MLLTLAPDNDNPSQFARAAPVLGKDWCGLFLPITTPFRSDGKLDLEGSSANIRKWNQLGVAGYVVLGSTGERVHLDEREYVDVIEAARLEVPAGFAFIAGAGQQSTSGTIAEIKRAASAGADAVLVLTPHFYRAAITPAVLIKHYNEIADASAVPLILYSMPALTGIKIEPETAARLSAHENIIGLKDSSADISGLQEVISMANKDFAVFTGNGTVFFEGLRAGARGGILAVGCVAPALCGAISAAANLGEMDRAALLQAALTPLATAVTTKFGIGGLKAALEMRGYAGGLPRAPLRAPDEAARREIKSCLEDADNALHELAGTGAGATH